jgi:arylsulfatase A-like enzyme
MRTSARVAIACAAALAAAACQSAAPAPPRAQPAAPTPLGGRPNIVLILTDDLDVGPITYMPVLQAQLVRRGLTFGNSFVVEPVCAPSRASLLTGRYVHNHKLLANRPPVGGYKRFPENGNEDANIGIWMQTAGYRTGLIGKYLNRYPTQAEPNHVPKGWTDWHALFFPESYWEFRMNENGKVAELGKTDDEYQTDVLTTKALEFLGTSDPRPFFLYLAPFAPHAPAEPAQRHESAFPGMKAPRPPSYNEEDVSDKPTWVRNMPRMDQETIDKSDDWYRRRVQTMLAVDEMIGRVLQSLEAHGQLGRTYVIFTSDNGFHLGEHRLDHGKGDAYEESIRVPLIVRGPGVPEGHTVEHLAVNIDLAPTFVSLAGGTIPPVVDGRSLVPLLGAQPLPAKEWRQDVLIEQFEDGRAHGSGSGDNEEDGTLPEYAALRTVGHTYVEYTKTGERELYDIRKDPYQLQNMMNTAPAELVQHLSGRLSRLKVCAGASCRE